MKTVYFCVEPKKINMAVKKKYPKVQLKGNAHRAKE